MKCLFGVLLLWCAFCPLVPLVFAEGLPVLQHDLTPVYQPTELESWRCRPGDDPAYAALDYDDRDWAVVAAGAALAGRPSVCWFRRELELSGALAAFQFLAVALAEQPSAYEIYWDGNRVAANGVVGSDTSAEVVGRFNGLHPLAVNLATPGRHLLAVRLSNVTLPRYAAAPRVTLATRDYFRGVQADTYYFHLLIAGILVVAGALSLVAFVLGDRRWAFFFLVLLCGLYLMEILFAIALTILRLSLTLLPLKNAFYLLLPSVSAWFGIAFVVLFAGEAAPRRMAAVAIPVLAALTALCALFGLPMTPVFFVPLLVAVRALRRGRTGLWPLIGGLVPFVCCPWPAYAPPPMLFSLALVLFLLGVMIAYGFDLKAIAQARFRAEMRSARLETQLLKKHIHPHFLMNTLLSIISWIEERPARATAMVHALADEFRLIDRISAQPLVAFADELALCRAHLEIMGGRKDAAYHLEVEGDDDGLMLPPLLLHTLIENAITHAWAPGEDGAFVLTIARTGSLRHLCLRNSGSLLAAGVGALADSEGVGFRYVRARLRESFGDDWQLTYGMEDDSWVVRLVFPAV